MFPVSIEGHEVSCFVTVGSYRIDLRIVTGIDTEKRTTFDTNQTDVTANGFGRLLPAGRRCAFNHGGAGMSALTFFGSWLFWRVGAAA